jgi:hypothetical protein
MNLDLFWMGAVSIIVVVLIYIGYELYKIKKELKGLI